MTMLRKSIMLILALALVFGMAAPGLQVLAAENLIEIKVDGYENYDEVQAVFEQVNAQRKANGLPALTLHPVLNNYAMQRAAELQVFYSHFRPDGTEYYTIMDSVFRNGASAENITYGDQDADAAMKCWMESDVHRSAILNPDFKSVGIGCFYTEDGNIAWVQIFSSEKWHMNDSTTGVRRVEDVTVQMLATNVVAQLDHSNFSNKYCALYVYEGTTIGTGLSLLNVGALGKYIPIDENTDLSGYTYISGDPNILSVNQDGRTLTAVSPGKTTLRIQHNGEDVLFHDAIASFLTYELNVEVMELPSLSYTMDGRCYAIDYSHFNTSAWSGLCLWIKGNHDEMWMMGNIERDGVYDFYPTDLTDTYVCVMRYFDEYLDRYVEVGERLVIQLGDEEPDPPTEPTEPSDPTEPEETEPTEPEIFVPTAADLPHRDTEPSVADVRQIMQELKQGYYPDGAVWPDTLTYQLNVDAQNDYRLEYSYGWIAAVSDLIFGDLPACVVNDPSLNDLRPGDILTWGDGDILVTDLAADYIEGACVDSSGEIQWKNLYPVSILSNAYLITRYESDAPGMDAFSIGIVPRDAVIVAQGDESCYNNRDEMLSFVRWTLTDDGTLYIYGDGSSVDLYKGAFHTYGWEEYRLQVKWLVVGGCLDSLADSLFAVNYPNLQEVTIRSRMEELDEMLFYRSAGLEKVTLLAPVETIGNRAFSGCSALKEVFMENGTRSIEQDAFFNCVALTDVQLPESLKYIGVNAFCWSTNLNRIQFPEGLEEIDDAAFERSGLEELSLPAGLKKLGSGVFSELANLKKLFINSDLLESGSHIFSGCTALEEVGFGENVTTLAEYMFSSTPGLKSVTIPGSVKVISKGVFASCDNLETVTIGQGVEVIGEAAFRNDTNLKALHLPNTLKRIEQDAFYNLDGANVDFYFYGTPEQWETVEIESGNWGVELWAWNFNFMDPNVCRHENTETIPGRAPTCTETGLSDGTVCLDCGETVKAQTELPVADHEFDAVETAPTCTEGGHTTYTCVNCGYDYADHYTGALGHTYENGSCIRCGEAEPEKPANPFGDVKENDYFFEPVLWAVDNGITSGTGNGRFSPEQTCTRAQVVTFLWRAMGKPAPQSTVNPFTDVNSGDYFYEAVLWAVENGITAGTGGTNFSPNAPCTRGQVVTFLWRAMGKVQPGAVENPFADVTAQDYYYAPVLWAMENGVTSGTSATTFAPGNPCTRGQVVTFLYRAMN